MEHASEELMAQLNSSMNQHEKRCRLIFSVEANQPVDAMLCFQQGTSDPVAGNTESAHKLI
jgi:hypothetical protein